MYLIYGTLRDVTPLNTGAGVKLLKVKIEHHVGSSRGAPELSLDTLMLPEHEQSLLPPAGQPVTLEIRPYSKTGPVSIAAISVFRRDNAPARVSQTVEA